MSSSLDLYWATQEDLNLGPLKGTKGCRRTSTFWGGDAGIQRYVQKVQDDTKG